MTLSERARRDTFLSFSPPTIGEEEIAEVVDTLRRGWLTTGPKTKRFEAEFARYVGAPHALGVSSCTAALEVCLAAIGVGAGAEVIVPTLTFCATANVVVHLGGTPVIADVCDDDLNLDPVEVERKLSPRTKAIIPVHFGGQPCRLDTILDLARARGVFVLEDAAHAVGAEYRGTKIGAIGDATAFSFYATKNLTTGEGGMLTTADAELAARASVLALHGLSHDAWKRYSSEGSWYYEVVAPGFKFNLTDIQSSLGLHQLAKLEAFLARRGEIAAQYAAAFADFAAIRTPASRPEVRHAWHLYPIRVRRDALTIDRARFIDELRERNIGSSVHFIPLHRHPYYRDRFGLTPADFPRADAAYEELISLPLHPGLSENDVTDVIDAVRAITHEFRR